MGNINGAPTWNVVWHERMVRASMSVCGKHGVGVGGGLGMVGLVARQRSAR